MFLSIDAIPEVHDVPSADALTGQQQIRIQYGETRCGLTGGPWTIQATHTWSGVPKPFCRACMTRWADAQAVADQDRLQAERNRSLEDVAAMIERLGRQSNWSTDRAGRFSEENRLVEWFFDEFVDETMNTPSASPITPVTPTGRLFTFDDGED